MKSPPEQWPDDAARRAPRTVHRRRRVGVAVVARTQHRTPPAPARPRVLRAPAVTAAGWRCSWPLLRVAYALTALTFRPRRARSCRRIAPTSSAGCSTAASSATSTTSPSWSRRPRCPRPRSTPRRLVRELKARARPLKRIAYRIDPKQFEGRALLYLSKEQLAEIRDKIFDYQEFMEAFAAPADARPAGRGHRAPRSPARFASGLHRSRALRRQGRRSISASSRTSSSRSPSGSIGRRRTARRSAPSSRWPAATRASAGYFLSEDQRLLFILAEPSQRGGQLHRRPRGHRGHPRGRSPPSAASSPTSQVGVTGKPALSNDEMTAAFRDSERATDPRLRPHPRPPAAGLHAGGQAAR